MLDGEQHPGRVARPPHRAVTCLLRPGGDLVPHDPLPTVRHGLGSFPMRRLGPALPGAIVDELLDQVTEHAGLTARA